MTMDRAGLGEGFSIIIETGYIGEEPGLEQNPVLVGARRGGS